jgi:hypothetical protein
MQVIGHCIDREKGKSDETFHLAMRVRSGNRRLRHAATSGRSTGGGNVNHADQLCGWFVLQHNDRLRWDVGRWSHKERECGRNSARARGKPKLPNYNNAPNLTIANGLAQLDFSILKFQGYVTPQGALVMRTGAGQRFEGQINSQNVLAARVIGGCVYDASWKRA